MKRTLIIGLLGVLPVSANADDMYQRRRKPPVSLNSTYDWTGVYFGLHLDMAQTQSSIKSSVQKTTGSYDAGAPYGSLDLGSRGFLGGVQVGYNHQMGVTVIGFEGDGSFGSVSGSKTTVVPGLQQIEAGYSTKDTFSASIRGRFGFAVDNVLIYGTAGAAIRGNESKRTQYATLSPQYATGSKPEAADFSTSPKFVEETKTTVAGLALGVGIEYATSLGWSVYASYLHTKWNQFLTQNPKALDSVFDYTTTSVSNGRDNKIGSTTQVLRFGLNYKL